MPALLLYCPMEISLEQIFSYPPIMGVTINTVWLSPDFREVLLWLLAFVLCGGLIVFLVRNMPLLQAVRRAALTSFFVGSLVYALHADIGWSSWVVRDYHLLSGKSTDEKVLALEGPLYEFALRSRRVLKTDYSLPNDAPDNYLTRRYQYFMLPLQMRPDAPAIVIIGDRSARYDPEAGVYTRGDVVVRNVRPLLLFTQDAYIIARPGQADAPVW